MTPVEKQFLESRINSLQGSLPGELRSIAEKLNAVAEQVELGATPGIGVFSGSTIPSVSRGLAELNVLMGYWWAFRDED